MKKLIPWILSGLFVLASSVGASVVLPYTFTSGTSISATQVNANFGALRDEINGHEAQTNPHQTTLENVLIANNSCGTHSINFNENEALKMRLENLSVDPAPGNAGRIFFNTSDKDLKIDTGSVIAALGGTGFLEVSMNLSDVASASASFNHISPMTALGDVIYGGALGAGTRLSGNTTATKKFLSQTGTGSVSAAPSWATLVGSDLPNPSASTLGGVQSIASVSHNFLTAISTSGVPAQAQPAFTDISGSVAATQLPNPSSSTLGGIQSAAPVSNQWINSISTSGVPALSQPAFTNLSGNLATAQLPSAQTWPSSGTVQATTPNNHGVLISGSGATATVLAPNASTTKILTSGGSSADPTWSDPAAASTAGYFHGYYATDFSTNYWSTTSGSYADLTKTGSISLTTNQSSGFGSVVVNGGGVALTTAPTHTGKVLVIVTTTVQCGDATQRTCQFRLIDNQTSTVFGYAGAVGYNPVSNAGLPLTIMGIASVTNGTAFLPTLQAKVSGGTVFVGYGANLDAGLTWEFHYLN